MPGCGDTLCKVSHGFALLKRAMKYSGVGWLRFPLQRLKGKPPTTSFTTKTNEHWVMTCSSQPQQLWLCGSGGFHAEAEKMSCQNGVNVQMSFYLLLYFMSIIYDDLQIEGAFHLPLFYKH